MAGGQSIGICDPLASTARAAVGRGRLGSLLPYRMRDIDTPRALRLAQRAPHAPSAPVALGWAAAPERSRACSSTRIARQGKRWETCCKVAHVCRMREIPRSRTTPRRLKRFSSVLMNSAPLRRLRAGTRGSAPSGGYHDAPGAWNPPSRAAADPRSSSMQHSRGSPVGKHADSGVAQNILGVCISPEVCQWQPRGSLGRARPAGAPPAVMGLLKLATLACAALAVAPAASALVRVAPYPLSFGRAAACSV